MIPLGAGRCILPALFLFLLSTGLLAMSHPNLPPMSSTSLPHPDLAHTNIFRLKAHLWDIRSSFDTEDRILKSLLRFSSSIIRFLQGFFKVRVSSFILLSSFFFLLTSYSLPIPSPFPLPPSPLVLLCALCVK